MSGPPRNRRGCSNCPKPPAAQSSPPEQRVLQITTDSEGDRLWKHVLFGTSTCLAMIEGYADLAMPGDPRDTLVSFRDRLNTLIERLR